MSSNQLSLSLQLLSLISMISLASRAQDHHIYDSLYHPLSGYSGNAKFSYHIDSKGKRVKDGEFIFKSKTVDSSCNTSVNKLVWMGHYYENHKTGDWEYVITNNDFQLTNIDDDFKIDYRLRSVREVLKAQYVEGVPNGKWRLEREVLKDRKPERMVRSVRTNVRQANLNGFVEIFGHDDHNMPYSIEGETDNGLMVEEWTLSYYNEGKNIIEKRFYNQGFLLNIIQIEKATVDTILSLKFPHSDKVQSYLQTGEPEAVNVPLSLTYNDGYPRNSKYISAQSVGNDLLRDAMLDLFKFEEDFFEEHGLPLGSNRMYYPLSSEETQILKQWADIEFRFRDKVNSLDELSSVHFKYNENDTLVMIEEWVTRQLFLIEYIKPWNEIIAKNEIGYYNRTGILFDYTLELLNDDSLKSGRVFNYDVGHMQDSSMLFYITANFKERIELANEQFNTYDRIVRKLDLAAEIVFLEEKISRRKMELDTLYGQPINNNKARLELVKSIKEKHLTTSFDKRYNEFLHYNGSTQVQKTKGDSLIFDMRLLRESYGTVTEIYNEEKRIDTLYTEYVFDAYTFNDRFPKRIKKKLYQSVAVDLFNDLLNEALAQDSPAEMLKTLHLIRRMQERLVFLSDKGTGKLERKLKQKMTKEKKLELLKID